MQPEIRVRRFNRAACFSQAVQPRGAGRCTHSQAPMRGANAVHPGVRHEHLRDRALCHLQLHNGHVHATSHMAAYVLCRASHAANPHRLPPGQRSRGGLRLCQGHVGRRITLRGGCPRFHSQNDHLRHNSNEDMSIQRGLLQQQQTWDTTGSRATRVQPPQDERQKTPPSRETFSEEATAPIWSRPTLCYAQSQIRDH